MSKQPFFSLVMPAYNCRNVIGKTIISIQEQEWSDFECIIVNDGSTDDTEEVIHKMIKDDDRFSTFSILNGGPGNARNKGIDRATGKYLYLLDSDDGLPKGTLQQYTEVLKNKNPDLIVSSYQMNVMDKSDIVDKRIVQVENKWVQSHEEFLDQLYLLMEKQLMYVIWNKVYKLDIIKTQKIQFPPYSSCEDRLFNIGYYNHVETCCTLNAILYHYSFDGKNSLTNRFLVNKFETFEEFYLALLDLTEKNKDGTSALFLKGTMSCIIPLHSKDCPYTFTEKRKEIKRILENETVKNAAEASSTNTMIRKVMASLFKSRSVFLNYVVSLMMYATSQMSPRVIEKLKGNF